jgi:S-adenosylmethionine synthetase
MIIIEPYQGKPVAEHRVEIVERKGTGHPDYMCDSIMEAISVELSKEYMREFGTVLHYNIDKGLLAAGKVYKWFGGGKILKPMELTIGDRATFKAAGKSIPVADIAIETAQKEFEIRGPGKAREVPRGSCTRFCRTHRYFFPSRLDAGGE